MQVDQCCDDFPNLLRGWVGWLGGDDSEGVQVREVVGSPDGDGGS